MRTNSPVQEAPAATTIKTTTVETTTAAGVAEAVAKPDTVSLSVKGNDLREFFDSMSPDDYGNYIYYLTRLDPETRENQLDGHTLKIDPADHADAFGQGWSGLQEWIFSKLGGSPYRLRINTTYQYGKQHGRPGTQTVCSNTFVLKGPPKYTQKEIEGGLGTAMTGRVTSSSTSELAALQMVLERIEKMQAQGQNAESTVNSVIQMAERMSSKILEKAGAAPSSTPEEQLSQIKESITSAISTLADRLKPEDSETREDRFWNRLKQLKEMGIVRVSGSEDHSGSAQPAKSLGEQLKEALDVAKLAGYTIGSVAGGGAEPSWAGALIDLGKSLVEHLPDLLTQLRGRALTGGAASAVIMGGPAQPRDPSPNVHANPGNPAEMRPAPAPAPAPQPQSGNGQLQVTPEQFQAVGQMWLFAKIAEALETGREGMYVASAIEILEPRFAAILKASTKDQLLDFVKRDPTLARIASHPGLPAFIDSFYQELHPPESADTEANEG